MYAEDSFHTLSGLGQAGLVLLTLLFSVSTLAFAGELSRYRGLPARIALSLLVFWGFEWISPQVYYQYYHLLFDGLPWQWVIGAPPGPKPIIDLLTFSGPATLSAHGRGLLGWLLILSAGIGWWRLRRNAAN